MAGQHAFPQPCTKLIFIGIAGRIGAGKTSAAMYLTHKYGLQYRRYSQVLDEWIAGGASDKDRLQRIGWDVMAGRRQAELNARLIAGLDHSKGAAIDGLRHVIDFESLSSVFGPRFEMIFLEARPENRFGRLQARFSTIAAFRGAESHPVEAHIEDLRPRASVTMTNDGSPEHLYQQLDAWVATRRSGD